MSRYHEVYAASQKDPQAFWGAAAQDLVWSKPYDKVFDPSQGEYGKWFTGGECSTAYNCLDRHVDEGNGDRNALIYDSPVTKTQKTYTYRELRDEVATLAAVMSDMGVKKGDRVIIYMPLIPQALMAMVACTRIGAVHSVVFGGFAAAELATRINDSKPVMILSASGGIEGSRVVQYKPLLDKAIELAEHKPSYTLIFQRDMAPGTLVEGRDFDWAASVADAKAQGRFAPCVPVGSNDPLYILYTSGTTGAPKGILREAGGHMVAIKWTMSNHYGVKPGDVFWAASDVGWIVGHSYIVYGPLLHGCTTVIYEGKPVGTPDAGAFWRMISEHKINVLFTAPTAIRAIKREDGQGEFIKKYDLSSLRTLFLAGERADPETIKWSERNLNIPVIDHWWQTETGWAICGNPVGLGQLPVKYGSSGVPMPGYTIDVLDERGQPVSGPNIPGTLAIKLPLPPGCLPTLWNATERFRNAYLRDFPGYYTTADAGFRDEDGYVNVMARTDDVINVAGHRLSTGQMEEVMAMHPDIAESAVIGVADDLKGQMPVGFAVLNANVNRPEADIEKEVVALVRNHIGAVAAFKTLVVVNRLPKTRSGKILRNSLRKIADHEPWTVPATIDDPGVLEDIEAILAGRKLS